jgi:hypothetical protein
MPFDFKKNKWIIVGGAGAAGLVVFLYIRNKNSASSAGTTTSSAATTGIDPATGFPYGSVQDQQALAASGGYPGSSYTSAYPGGLSGVQNTGGYSLLGVNPSTIAGSGFASNAAWAQAVTAGLTQLGYSGTDIAAALGLFFAQQPLGSGADGVSYAEIVRAAEAEFGPPPQGTYSIVPEPSSHNPPPPGPGPATVAVPNVVGQRVNAGIASMQNAGLKATTQPLRNPADEYTVTSTSPSAGTQVAVGSTVTLNVQVSATPGPGSPPPATLATVPYVRGQRAQQGINTVQNAGFHVVTSPERDSRFEYKITGSHPVAGTRAAKGSTVTLSVQRT